MSQVFKREEKSMSGGKNKSTQKWQGEPRNLGFK